MKQQQLFNSLCLSLAFSALTTQPAWADTVQVDTVSQRQTQNAVTPADRDAKAADILNLEVTQTTPPNLTFPASPSPANPDVSTQQIPVPSYLNPNPNPLQFPTRPDEVRIQGTQPITLQQAFELARRNNRQLQVAELTLRRSTAFLREQQAALFPTLTTNQRIVREQSAGGQQSVGRAEAAAAAAIAAGQPPPQITAQDPIETSYSGDVTLSYSLFTSGARNTRIRAAEGQVRFDQLDVERQFEDLRLNVSNDYYNLQGADQQVRISQEAVRNAQASLRDAQALEQAGVGTRFEVLQAQVQLANQIQTLTNALSQQRINRRQLATRLSLTQSLDVSAADPIQIAGLWNLPLEESIIVALKNRAELEQQLTQRNISEQNRRAALANLGPQFSLSASYNLLNGFDDGVSLADGVSVGGSVSVNLFDGGASRARAAQEEANIAIAETNFGEQRNQVRFAVEQGYAELQSNFTNIQTATVGLEQARESLRLARLRFQAGVGTQTDVINQQNALTIAEGNRVTAILDYNRALATLQRSISSGPPR